MIGGGKKISAERRLVQDVFLHADDRTLYQDLPSLYYTVASQARVAQILAPPAAEVAGTLLQRLMTKYSCIEIKRVMDKQKSAGDIIYWLRSPSEEFQKLFRPIQDHLLPPNREEVAGEELEGAQEEDEDFEVIALDGLAPVPPAQNRFRERGAHHASFTRTGQLFFRVVTAYPERFVNPGHSLKISSEGAVAVQHLSLTFSRLADNRVDLSLEVVDSSDAVHILPLTMLGSECAERLFHWPAPRGNNVRISLVPGLPPLPEHVPRDSLSHLLRELVSAQAWPESPYYFVMPEIPEEHDEALMQYLVHHGFVEPVLEGDAAHALTIGHRFTVRGMAAVQIQYTFRELPPPLLTRPDMTCLEETRSQTPTQL